MRNDTYEARRSLSAVVKLRLIQSTNYSHWKVFYFHFQLFWFSGTGTYIAQAGLEFSVHLKMSLNIWFSNLWLPSPEITGLCHCPWPFLFVFLCFEMGSCHVPLADLVVSVFQSGLNSMTIFVLRILFLMVQGRLLCKCGGRRPSTSAS